MSLKIFYPVIDAQISGGNIIALRIMEEALSRGYEVVANSPSEGKFTRLLREKGIQVYNIDTRRTFRFDCAIKLARIIKKENIGLVHSHTPLGGMVLSRLAGLITGVFVINHIHAHETLSGNFLVRHYQCLLNWITSRFFCVKLITVSESVKCDSIKHGTPADKITVVYNGIDLRRSKQISGAAEIRKEFSLRENQQIVGQVGRLNEFKGQHLLITAAAKVMAHFSDAVFIIVGEDLEQGGRYRRKLEILADNLGLRQKIIFTGYRSDVYDIVSALDILVLPSSIEGLPVVILEAMAAKKAVITTPVGGNPEIVVDGQTGTFVPAQDAGKLAEAIIYHLGNPEASRRMGEKGFERARRHFSLDEMLGKIMNLYKEVIKG